MTRRRPREIWEQSVGFSPGRRWAFEPTADVTADVTAAALLGGAHRDGDQDLVTAVWSRFEYRLDTSGSFGAPTRAHTVPSGGRGGALGLGEADGDRDLDVHTLISNVPAGTNPDDVVLRSNALTFTAATIPRASGIGDAVAPLDGNGDRRNDVLVLNGVEVSGPAQASSSAFQ